MSTVRIAASSSARRMCPLGMALVLKFGAAAVAGAVHGQQDAERRAPRGRIAFDDAPVIADDLRHQGKSEATSLGLGGDEWVEQVAAGDRRECPGRCRGRVISIGRLMRSFEPGTCRRTPVRNAVDEHDLALERIDADRLGGVLHEVEEHLDELVAVAEHRRQRRVVVLDEADMAGEARLGRGASPGRGRRGR